MLSDRSYMSAGPYPPERTRAHIWFAAAIVAAYVLELIALSWWPGAQKVVLDLMVTPSGLQKGHLWTLVTHALVHDYARPWHVLFVLTCLVLLGRELHPLIGFKRFSAVFAASLLLGALTWAGVHAFHGGVFYGATAGIAGLFIVLANLYPEQEIPFLVFFLFPVNLRPRYIVYGLLAIDLCALAFYEIPGAPAPWDYSASAHLGGMLAGWLYFRYFHARHGWDRASGVDFSLPAWLRRKEPASVQAAGELKINFQHRGDLRAEVDRILDKINSLGFGALTEQEKRLLDEAKDVLSRR